MWTSESVSFQGGHNHKNRCKIGSFQSNFMFVRVGMATQIEGFASLVDVSKDTHQGLLYGYRYWKSCFQNGSERASGSMAMPQEGDRYFCRRTRRKTHSIFETNFSSFDASARSPPLSAVAPRGVTNL